MVAKRETVANPKVVLYDSESYDVGRGNSIPSLSAAEQPGVPSGTPSNSSKSKKKK